MTAKPGILASVRRGGFDPLSIPWALAFWADRITGVTDGGPIAQWNDQSGNGRHATQANAASQPTLQMADPGLGGRRSVRFDGTDDRLVVPDTFELVAPNEFVAVARWRSGATLWDGVNSGKRHLLDVSSGKWRIFAGGAVSSAVNADTTGHHFRAVYAGFDGSLSVDGSTVISGNPGNQNLGGLSIGANTGGSNPGGWDVAFIGVSDSLLTAQQRTDLLAWSRTKYGTP